MIYGIGIDIVGVKRINYLIRNNQFNIFIKRILTKKELILLPKNKKKLTAYVAKRFAAKEAFSKALGCGIGKECSFQDLSICNDEKGKPYFGFYGKVKNLMSREKLKAQISLSDEKKYAIAMVVIERNSQ